MENFEYYSLLQSGIQIRNPYKTYIPVTKIYTYEKKYGELRFSNLIWKIQKRISLFRWIILIILKIISSTILLGSGLYGAYYISLYSQSDFVAMQCGVIIAMILWLNIIIPYGIETDPNNIRFKHKGKIY